MNATDLFVGLVAGSGGKEGKLWDVREDAPEKADGFRQVFARVFEQARGNEQPPPKVERTEAKRQDGSESSTARLETASRPERKPAEETLNTARKLLRAIIEKLEKEKEKLAEELPDEQLVAMLMNLIALLLAGNEDESLKFLEDLGWLQEGGTVIDLKVSMEGIADEGIAVGETEELLAALQQWLEKAEEDPENAGQLRLLIRLSEDEAVSIPLDRFNPDGEGKAQLVLNLTADAEAEPICLVVDASCVEQAEVVPLNAEVSKDAELFLSLAGSQEELLGEEGAPDEKVNVFELEVLKALRQQTGESPAKPRQSIIVPLEMQGRGEANVQNLSPEVRDFLMALMQKATEGETSANGGPEVATANPMYTDSEQYLQVLDYLAFLQSLAGKTQGKTLGERLALMMNADGEEGFSLTNLLLKGDSSQRLVEKLLEDMKGDDATKRWRSELFEARAVRLSDSSRADRSVNNTSEQIPFLPRTATQSFSLSDMVNRAAEAMPKPSQVSSQDVVNQVVQRISYTFFNGNEGEVKVFLRPENLGDLQVKVRLEHEVMVAKFVAQSQEVKAIIENNLGQLRNALEQQGIKVAEMVVTVDSGFKDQAEGGWNQEASEQANRGQLPGETAAAYEEGLFVDAETYYGNSKVYTTSISQVNYFA